VLQTGFGLGLRSLPLGSGLELDSKKLESDHLWSLVSCVAILADLLLNLAGFSCC